MVKAKISNPLKIGVHPGRIKSVEEDLEWASECERLGFHSFWFEDHMVYVTKGFAPHVMSLCAATSVQTSKIKLCVITDPHRINPAILAQQLATVDTLSGGGRLILCLGPGEAMNLTPFDIRWDKPVSRLVEVIGLIRRFWTSDAPFDYDGQFFKMRKAYIEIKPKGFIPIYIAANRPRTRKITAEVGDGWVPATRPPSLYAKQVEELNEFAVKAGRTPENVEKSLYLITSMDRDREAAYKAIEPIRHALIWFNVLAEAGYDVRIPEKYRGLDYGSVIPTDENMKQLFREMGQYYSREILLDFTLTGNEDDCLEKLKQYENAGVNHVIIANFSPNPRWALETFAKEILPHFREK